PRPCFTGSSRTPPKSALPLHAQRIAIEKPLTHTAGLVLQSVPFYYLDRGYFVRPIQCWKHCVGGSVQLDDQVPVPCQLDRIGPEKRFFKALAVAHHKRPPPGEPPHLFHRKQIR